jgi:hypothetical protein
VTLHTSWRKDTVVCPVLLCARILPGQNRAYARHTYPLPVYQLLKGRPCYRSHKMTSNGTAVAHKPHTVNHQKQSRSCPAIIRGMAGNRGLTQSMPDESEMQISVKTLGQRPATRTWDCCCCQHQLSAGTAASCGCVCSCCCPCQPDYMADCPVVAVLMICNRAAEQTGRKETQQGSRWRLVLALCGQEVAACTHMQLHW